MNVRNKRTKFTSYSISCDSLRTQKYMPNNFSRGYHRSFDVVNSNSGTNCNNLIAFLFSSLFRFALKHHFGLITLKILQSSSVPFAFTLLVYSYSGIRVAFLWSDNILRKIKFLLPWSADWQTDATPKGRGLRYEKLRYEMVVEKFELENLKTDWNQA